MCVGKSREIATNYRSVKFCNSLSVGNLSFTDRSSVGISIRIHHRTIRRHTCIRPITRSRPTLARNFFFRSPSVSFATQILSFFYPRALVRSAFPKSPRRRSVDPSPKSHPRALGSLPKFPKFLGALDPASRPLLLSQISSRSRAPLLLSQIHPASPPPAIHRSGRPGSPAGHRVQEPRRCPPAAPLPDQLRSSPRSTPPRVRPPFTGAGDRAAPSAATSRSRCIDPRVQDVGDRAAPRYKRVKEPRLPRNQELRRPREQELRHPREQSSASC